MQVPSEIVAQGPEAVAEFWRGYYIGCRIRAAERLLNYGIAANSRLTEGDERGQGLPPLECLEWPRHGWHFYPGDLFHE